MKSCQPIGGSSKSRALSLRLAGARPPWIPTLDHSVEDSEKFAHAGRDRHLFGLAHRHQNSRMTGLWRVAQRVAMYSVDLSPERPPQVVRILRRVPESLFRGAPPATAARLLQSRLPNSCSSVSSVAGRVGSTGSDPSIDRPFSRFLPSTHSTSSLRYTAIDGYIGQIETDGSIVGFERHLL